MADVAFALGRQVAGFVQPGLIEPALLGADANGAEMPLLGTLDDVHPAGASDEDVEFVIALGANARRRDAFDHCLELGWTPATLVHPSAILLGGARVGAGSQVCAAAVIGVDAVIGADVIVNTAASIDHDGAIADHAFIGPGARLAGRVNVETGAHIGIGAVVREGCTIGAWAYVAAGAVVVHDVADGVRVAGVPARPMERAVPEEENG
jgi:sugar O-acyltransferase (sialic acid O-acetyltransferase NeuD family)